MLLMTTDVLWKSGALLWDYSQVEQKLETYRIPAKVDVDIEKPVQ